MRADNDNEPFGGLPLFATDREIAVAVVGKARASNWISAVLPTLRNFPPIDARHGGRPVPLVKRYYDDYFGLAQEFSPRAASGEENLEVWTKKRKRAA